MTKTWGQLTSTQHSKRKEQTKDEGCPLRTGKPERLSRQYPKLQGRAGWVRPDPIPRFVAIGHCPSLPASLHRHLGIGGERVKFSDRGLGCLARNMKLRVLSPKHTCTFSTAEVTPGLLFEVAQLSSAQKLPWLPQDADTGWGSPWGHFHTPALLPGA